MQTPDACKLFKGQEVLAFHFHHLRTSPPSLEPCTARLLPTASSPAPPPQVSAAPHPAPDRKAPHLASAIDCGLGAAPGRCKRPPCYFSRPRGGARRARPVPLAVIGPPCLRPALAAQRLVRAAARQRVTRVNESWRRPPIGSADGVRIVRPARTASRRRRSAAAGGATRERVTA